MEYAGATTPHDIPLRTEVIRKSKARIDVVHVVVEHAAGPGFPLVPQPAGKREAIGGAPLILNEQAVVSVRKLAFRLIANCIGNSCRLIDSGSAIDRGFGEIAGGIEAFKENHKWRS